MLGAAVHFRRKTSLLASGTALGFPVSTRIQ